MPEARILVAEDEALMRGILERLLAGEGHRVFAAADGQKAWEIFEREQIDLVLTDLRMPGMDGMELLHRVRAEDGDALVIVITAFGSVESAVEAMKQGAHDYIAKPFINDDIKLSVRKALEQRRLVRENRALREALRERHRFEQLVGRSPAMQQVYALMEKVCRTRANLLISGESGTGKERVAQAIHYHSERSAGPFLAVNCAALAENLLESELFGHVKGAFTGALAAREGYFRRAGGGTLFLDEIGELAPDLQVRLLRAVQERQVTPVGSTEPVEVDVRLICATHRDLEEEVRQQRFREDLYYRINVVQIELPPLRQRRDDIALLALHFLERCAGREGRRGLRFSKEALERLREYEWPGNVRELENAVERAVVLVEDERIGVEHLPERVRAEGVVGGRGEMLALAQVEKGHILRVLEQVGGNKARAAEILGINLATLYRKLHRYEQQD